VEVEENFAGANAFPRALSKGNTFCGLKMLEISDACAATAVTNLEVLSVQCCSEVEELIKVRENETTSALLSQS